MTRRTLILAYGLLAYAATLATLIYLAGFVGGILTPTQLDEPRQGSLAAALVTDLGLLVLFALQHSGMARPGFKRWLTRFVPPPAERSTYCLLSSAALFLLFWLWQPIEGTVWEVGESARPVLYAVYAAGWVVVLATSFLINHFDLFGLRQVWLEFRGRPYTPLAFKTPGLYRLVRHPLYVGLLLAFWAAPTMTVAHLLFALVTTAYILVAIRWEERDLETFHPEYAGYRRRVPMLAPLPRGAGRDVGASAVPAPAVGR
jgi:methanethiol S-methyltransferase